MCSRKREVQDNHREITEFEIMGNHCITLRFVAKHAKSSDIIYIIVTSVNWYLFCKTAIPTWRNNSQRSEGVYQSFEMATLVPLAEPRFLGRGIPSKEVPYMSKPRIFCIVKLFIRTYDSKLCVFNTDMEYVRYTSHIREVMNDVWNWQLVLSSSLASGMQFLYPFQMQL